jgi:hypothetical protein
MAFKEILLQKKEFVNDQLDPRPTRNEIIFLQHHKQNLRSCMRGIDRKSSKFKNLGEFDFLIAKIMVMNQGTC